MSVKENKMKQKFDTLVDQVQPKKSLLKDCINAFWVGGLICVIGQFFNNYLLSRGISADDVGTYVSIIMIFIGALLTGIGVYDKIANFAGAGTVCTYNRFF